MSPRRGMTLVELQVAMLVGGLICVAGVTALLHLRRAVDAVVREETAERRGAEAISVVEALGRHLRHPVIIGDTAVQGELRIAVGVVCQGTSAWVALAPAVAGSLEAMTFLADLPVAGDRLEFVAVVRDSAEAGWHSFPVVEADLISSQEGCGVGNPYVASELGARSVVRVTHDLRLAPVGAGAPVEIYRVVRVVLYRAPDAGWVIGLRQCADRQCGPAQPIVGPVRSPREGGLRFHRTESEGLVTVTVRVPAMDHAFLGVFVATPALP